MKKIFFFLLLLNSGPFLQASGHNEQTGNHDEHKNTVFRSDYQSQEPIWNPEFCVTDDFFNPRFNHDIDALCKRIIILTDRLGSDITIPHKYRLPGTATQKVAHLLSQQEDFEAKVDAHIAQTSKINKQHFKDLRFLRIILNNHIQKRTQHGIEAEQMITELQSQQRKSLATEAKHLAKIHALKRQLRDSDIIPNVSDSESENESTDQQPKTCITHKKRSLGTLDADAQQPKSDNQKSKPFITRQKIAFGGLIVGVTALAVAWNTKSGKETMLNLVKHLGFGGQSAITLNTSAAVPSVVNLAPTLEIITPAAPASLMPEAPKFEILAPEVLTSLMHIQPELAIPTGTTEFSLPNTFGTTPLLPIE